MLRQQMLRMKMVAVSKNIAKIQDQVRSHRHLNITGVLLQVPPPLVLTKAGYLKPDSMALS